MTPSRCCARLPCPRLSWGIQAFPPSMVSLSRQKVMQSSLIVSCRSRTLRSGANASVLHAFASADDIPTVSASAASVVPLLRQYRFSPVPHSGASVSSRILTSGHAGRRLSPEPLHPSCYSTNSSTTSHSHAGEQARRRSLSWKKDERATRRSASRKRKSRVARRSLLELSRLAYKNV